MSSRLVIGLASAPLAPGFGSNSGLSRLVSFSSSAPTRQVPSFPRASSALSSSSLTRHAAGTSVGALAPAFDLDAPAGFEAGPFVAFDGDLAGFDAASRFDAASAFGFDGSFGIGGASASAALTAVVVATASSRATVDGSRPASTPLNAAWRTIPSRDHPPSSARITSSGLTQVMS